LALIKEIDVQYVHHGKWIIAACVASVMFAVATPECSLEVRSADGAAVTMLGAGTPFQVVITAHDCAEQPHVTFDESPFAALRRVSVQTRTINGNSSVSYVYSARIDRTGLYDIGPAQATIAGKIYHTNKCEIEVGEQTKTTGSRFMMQISLDEQELYVGQETTMRIRIYSATSAPEVEAIHIARVDGVSIGEFAHTDSGTEAQDGIKYRYKEFTAPFYAESAGKFLIPACSADIRDDQVRHGGFFFFSFSAIAPTKQVYSNTTSCTVKNLPHTAKPYALIGDYTAVEASVEPSLIELGQAARYRLTVYGMGNTAQAKAPLLSDMPATCKYYDSSVTPLSQEEGVVFEYIIQPRTVGTWEIPAQEVIYFNPSTKTYRNLTSDAVVITAQPSAAQQNQIAPPVKTENTQLNGTMQHDLPAADSLARKKWLIPWFWYWILVTLLWVSSVSVCLGRSVYGYYTKNSLFYKKKRAFYTARKALSAREQGKTTMGVHQIFVTLFADWFMVPESEITESFIKQKIYNAGMLSEDGAESWHRFWHTIVQEHYGNGAGKKISNTIFTEARLWITAFSKCVVR
jgi:hypothetical protein